jgi:phosphatidylserine decarboxylase
VRPRIARDGFVIAAVPALAALLAGVRGRRVLALLPAGLAGFVLWFFRDPDRAPPEGPICVAPADGRVVAVRDLGAGTSCVSIYLSLLDVHVNRSPVAGTVQSIRYQPGRFLVASKDAASTENEQNVVTVAGADTTVALRQIAGIAARRIVCWKRAGDRVHLGERVGLIRFGSRVEVEVGPEWQVVVQAGARVRAGESVVARRVDAQR